MARLAFCVIALWAFVAGAALDPGGWEPSVRERLDALIERNRGNPDAYAVFDFDYTTAIGDLSYVCMWQILETLDFKFNPEDFVKLMAEGVAARHSDEIDALAALFAKLRPFVGQEVTGRPEWRDFVRRYWALYRSIQDEVGAYRAYLWRSRVFTGYTPMELRRLAEVAVPRALVSGGLRVDVNAPTEKRGLAITKEIKNLFRELRKAGIAVYIVSGSYRDTLLVAAGRSSGLDVSPGNIFGAELKKDADGRFVAEMTDDCVKSGFKPEFIMARIAPRHHGAEPVLTAGDSMGDYTMLTEFKSLQLALVFHRNWKEKEMFSLCASGGKVAVQGRDEAKGIFIPFHESVFP